MNKVLLITLEPIGKRMAGPAIRCCELGNEIAKHMPATVYSPYEIDSIPQTLAGQCQFISGKGKKSLLKLASQHDILIIQANVLKQFPQLTKLQKFLVVDLYDPFLFNIHIQYANQSPALASSNFRLMHKVLEKHMLSADFTICASERQRDYWLGRFCALGRINPLLHNFDPSLRKLIDVVPFGLSKAAPQANGRGPREIFVKIKKADPILLWAGGIWDWLDPLTVIKAVSVLKEKIPNVRLVFMGKKSPNPQVGSMAMADKACQLATELKLLDENVFFAPDWISYQERSDFLLQADIGVSAHFDLPETRFSFRTRLLDYFWANLPIVTTKGDELAQLIETKRAGFVLDYQDVSGWTNYLTKLLTDKSLQQDCRQASKDIAQDFTWDKVAKSLLNYCENPCHLPDHIPVTMPNIIERANAVYQRGGKDLVFAKAKQMIKEIMPS